MPNKQLGQIRERADQRLAPDANLPEDSKRDAVKIIRGRIRTDDLRFRKPALYPLSYSDNAEFSFRNVLYFYHKIQF